MAKRTYEPHINKHKAPKGFGNLCQDSVSLAHAQELLDEAIPDPAEPSKRQLFAICGDAVFVARPTRWEKGIWHGYPEFGSRTPPSVLVAWEKAGRITTEQKRRLRRQKAMPERCGC